MISVAEAFGTETTAKALLHFAIEGHYDDDNRWHSGGYTEGLSFSVCMLPVGNSEGDTKGQVIVADPQGERYPATMKFRSRYQMPNNSVISYNGIDYKIIRQGDYSAGGYWAATGTSDTTINKIIVPEPIDPDFTIGVGPRQMSVAHLLEVQAYVKRRRT